MNMLKLLGIILGIVVISSSISAVIASHMYNKRGERKRKEKSHIDKLLELDE